MITIPSTRPAEKQDRKEALLLLLRDMSMELVALDTAAVDAELSRLN